MKKLLVVYNTCSLSGQEHIPYWVNSIQSLLFQNVFDNENVKLAISACAPGQMWYIQSQNTFHDDVSYNFIHENLPVSVTFNDTVEKCVKQFGEFENYLYVDSGINFWDPSGRYDALETLLTVHGRGGSSSADKTYNLMALTAALASNDDGRQWLGWDFIPGLNEYVFPVGQTCNLHCQLFSNEWRQAFGKVLPDIFASHTMESVFSIMTAAIHRKFQITKKIVLFHAHSLDGASIGSRITGDDRIPCSSMFDSGGLLFKTKKTMDERYREGVALGFGWEESKEPWKHDPDCFDSDGNAKSPELASFLARELYLKPEEFNYTSIKAQFIAGK